VRSAQAAELSRGDPPPSSLAGGRETVAALQLGQITGQVADSKDNAGYAATAARLRVAASVFGN
jgi:hypothetical protein